MKLWAERRAGEILITEMPHGGDRKSSTPRYDLKDAGISNGDSRKWRSLARIPEPSFAGHIAETKAKAKELTTADLLRYAKSLNCKTRPQQNDGETFNVDDLQGPHRPRSPIRHHWAGP